MVKKTFNRKTGGRIDWVWIQHRNPLAKFFGWMWFLEQLLWDLTKIVDKSNGGVLLQRVINAKNK